ncbi:MAG: GNAT family N-acetyltransferase [Planctomycetota bacterium]|nr:GNAT family N-acetyltransferase [Planctomycetota bacterium]
MTLSSLKIRGISRDESHAFLSAMCVPFGLDPTSDGIERLNNRFELDRLRVAVDGDEIVGTFGTFSLQMTVPGGKLPVGGTTVVTVMPTHRRQGVLRALMTQHLHELHERGEVLGALWASESAIYGRFGYGIATEMAQLKLPKPYARMQTPIDIAGSMRLLDKPQALEMFPAIFDAVSAERPGMFDRSASWWQHRTLADYEDHRGGFTAHRYVLQVRNDTPVGYVIYRTKLRPADGAGDVRIVELIAIDAQAEKSLWEFVFGIDLAGTITDANMPVDTPLRWWLEHPREMDRRVVDAMWIRPVDVAAALAGRKYSAPGTLCFHMADDLCPWNNGTYLLEADNDGTATCTNVDQPADLHLTPFTLGCVYLGGQRFQDLATCGLLVAKPEILKLADRMFAWNRQPWCQEIF